MALSMYLGLAGIPPEKIETEVTVTLEKDGDGFAVSASHLDVRATVPGASDAAFQKAANEARANCPISKLFNAKITIDAHLE